LKGIIEAARSVSVVCFLLLSILYVFSIIMVQLSVNTELEGRFPNVPEAMLVLFIQATLLDEISGLMDEAKIASIPCFVMLFLVIVLGAMTMMNMLVGILCEVVSTVADKEREAMSFTFIKEKVLETIQAIDKDGDYKISKDEFLAIIEYPKAVDALNEAGVDVVALVDVCDVVFQSDREGLEFDRTLDFDTFMCIIMKCCGTTAASVKDIVDVKKLMATQNKSVHDLLRRIMQNQKVIADRIKTRSMSVKRLDTDVNMKCFTSERLDSQYGKDGIDSQVSSSRAENSQLIR